MKPLPRSAARTLHTMLLTLWGVVASGVRIFVWDSFKEGLIDVRPLKRVARLLTVFGLLLIFGYLFIILFNDLLRTHTPLETLTFESGAGRGLLIPTVAVPLTLITVTLGWSYILAGALHVRRGVRWLVFALYIIFGFTGLAQGALEITPDLGILGLAPLGALLIAVLALLFVCFLILPRRTTSMAVEFSLILGLQAILTLISLAQAVSAQRQGGFPYISGYLLTSSLDLVRLLIMPFMLLSGSEMGNFARDVSSWVAKAARSRARGNTVSVLLALLLAWRWWRLQAGGLSADQARAWLGAGLLAAGIGAVYLWRRQQAGGENVPKSLIVWLIVLSQLFQMVLGSVLTIILFGFGLVSSMASSVDMQALLRQVNQASSAVSDLSTLYSQYVQLVLGLMALVVARLAWQRKQPTVAAFGLLLAWGRIVEWLTEPGRPLRGLHFQYSDVDTLLLVAVTAAAVYQAGRGRLWARGGGSVGLGSEQALRLLGMAILGWVLTQTSFLSDPFSPFFAFAGVFFLVFGILWGVLTAGGAFANADTADFPRTSRLLLYIGYVLLSVTISHWYIVSHNVEAQALQSDLTLLGFRVYGLALAYLIFVESGKPLLVEEEE